MRYRRSWLAAVLSVGVTMGGVVCACAAIPLDAGAGDAHQHHAAPDTASCERLDCAGSCGFDATLSERDPWPTKPSNLADKFEPGPALVAQAALSPTWRLRRAALPPPRLPDSDTPVRRFDTLLN